MRLSGSSFRGYLTSSEGIMSIIFELAGAVVIFVSIVSEASWWTTVALSLTGAGFFIHGIARIIKLKGGHCE